METEDYLLLLYCWDCCGDNFIMKTYITVLQVISAFSVVALHTNGCFWRFSYEKYWFTANIMESLFYYAVPIFFMITGVTLFDYTKRYDTKTFFLHRFHKTVVPFLFWSFVAIFIQVFWTKRIAFDSLTLAFIIDSVLKSTYCSYYWFFLPLFSVYLSIPLFASIAEDRKVCIFKYLIFSSFFINFLFPFILEACKIPITIPIPISVNTSSGLLFFSIVGWLLDQCLIDDKKRKLIYLFAIIGLLIHMVGTYIFSIKAGEIIKIFKGYTNVPCILYSIGVFVFIKHNVSEFDDSNTIHKNVLKICSWLKGYTFPIYLLHWFLIKVLVKLFHIDTKTLEWRIGGIFLLCFLSIIITWLVRKIPLLGKKILP